MTEDLLADPAQRDWIISINGEGADRYYELSGSRISSPQRYQLLSLLILFVTFIVPNVLTFVIGIWLAGWSSRRFSLSVSPQSGVELTLSMILPYKRLRLPLLSTQLKRIGHFRPMQKATASTSMGDGSHLVELILTHPELYNGSIPLIKVDHEIATALCQKFAHWVRESYHIRSSHSREPLELYKVEPGEWIIALIELFPVLLAPRRTVSIISTNLSYWSPQLSSVLISCTALMFGLVAVLLSPSFSVMMLSISILTLLSAREHIRIDRNHMIWRKSLLGVTTEEQKLSISVITNLESDLHAPSGRRLHLIDLHFNPKLLTIGNTWDAAWLDREIKKASARHLSCKLES